MKKSLILGVCGVFLIIILLFGMITTIETGERGVITRMGKLHGIMDEGLNFKLPFIDSVKKMSIREQNFPLSLEVSSKDMQTIKVDVSLVYAVNPGEIGTIYQRFGTEYQTILVSPTLAETVNSMVAEYPIESFVERRQEISARIKAVFVEKTTGNGLVVKDLLITNHDFSDEYNHAVEAKKIAEQGVLTARYNKERVALEAEAQKTKHTSLSPMVLQEMAINKWDGKLPAYWGGNTLPMLNLNK
ncbi:prohibitin family protein [Acetonema longum]|uniref:Band 7 domain-containing protein n=1 Tax=Acetonema longum DSM 6540 TaxID=1009370 RepID=F7NKA0_9FIRM|nr:prohibitin family protein [Acetonema longum]EGO63541.1 hypothetical protein ALO_12566 [Acetonema longum DSM 6540]